jgi:nucleotide-binding universal stress UspA family protein
MAVLHSYRTVADQLVQSKQADDASRQLVADACAKFLAGAALSEDSVARLQVLLESGPVESLVKSYAYDKGLDLLVIGSHGRTAVVDLLLGSTAAKLLSSAPCDVLVVRKARQAAGLPG